MKMSEGVVCTLARVMMVWLVICLFSKAGVNEGCKTFQCVCFISAVRNESDGHALNDTEREYAEKALCVNSAVILFNPDRALIGVRLLNEECSRSCMQTYIILNSYIT